MSSQYKKTFYVVIFLIVQSHCTQIVSHELENSDNVVQEQAQNKDRILMDIGKDAKSGLNIGIGKIFEGLELIAGHFDISSSGVEDLQNVIKDSFQEIKDNLSQQGQAINRMERILNQQQQTLEKQRGEQILRDERLEGQGQILTQIRGQQQQTLEQQRGEQILRDERMEGQGQILTQIQRQQQQMIDKQNELFELIDERKNISNQCEKLLERQHKTLARQDETLEKQVQTMGRLQNLLPRHNQTLLQRQKRQVDEHTMIDVHEQTFKELNKSIQSQQDETREELRYHIQMAVANISLIISANEEYQYRQMSPLLNDIRIIKDAINRDNEGDNQLRVHLATLLRDLTIITGKLEISNITAVLEFRESIKATLSQVLEALNRQENTLTNQDHKLNQLSQKLDQQGETLVESERTLKQQMTELRPHEGWFEQQQQALQDNTDILRMAMSNISLVLCKTQDLKIPVIKGSRHVRTHKLQREYWSIWSTQETGILAIGGENECVITLIHEDGNILKDNKLDIKDTNQVNSGVHVTGSSYAITVMNPLNSKTFKLIIIDINTTSHTVSIIQYIDLIKPVKVFNISDEEFGVLSWGDGGVKHINVFDKTTYHHKSTTNIRYPAANTADSICPSPGGGWCVGSRNNDKVYVFSHDGVLLDTLGTPAGEPHMDKPGLLYAPYSVHVDVDGGIVVTCLNGDTHRYSDKRWKILTTLKYVWGMFVTGSKIYTVYQDQFNVYNIEI